jgi:DNA-binding LytR/AlgR family response regulator
LKLTAILADDEELVRDLLKARLTQVWPELEIVAQASDGQEAIEMVAQFAPTFAFLDIRMPEKTGLQVAQIISERCHVVFLTAYDEYAVEAFERGAIDYMLKPVTIDRLQTTVERLKKRMAQQPVDLSQLFAQIEAQRGMPVSAAAVSAASLSSQLTKKSEQASDAKAAPEKLRWIQASVGRELRVISVDDVVYFEADEKYVVVHTRDAEAVIRTPLKELVDGLDEELFWPVHRATIVNVRMIEAVEKDVLGRLSIRLRGMQRKLPVSRTHSSRFKGM